MKHTYLKKIAVVSTAAALILAAVGTTAYTVFAQAGTPPAVAPAAAPQIEQKDQQGQTEVQNTGPMTDTLETNEQPGQPEVKDASGTPEQVDANEVKDSVAEQGETQDSAEGAETKDNEAADAAALAGKAKISAKDAEIAALAANPGTTVSKTDLGDENGVIVYDVELSNGSDVKVDAQTGKILGTDAKDTNEGGE